MKVFLFPFRLVERWRRLFSTGAASHAPSEGRSNSSPSTLRSVGILQQQPPASADSPTPLASSEESSQFPDLQSCRDRPLCRSRRIGSTVSFVVAVVSLTGAIGQRFYSQPRLGVGTIAPETIYADDSAVLTDEKTTEEQRKAARVGAIPIWSIDAAVDRQIHERLDRILKQGKEARQLAGRPAFLSERDLPADTQIYLRKAPEWEWQAIVAAAAAAENQNGSNDYATSPPTRNLLSSLRREAVSGMHRGLSGIVGTPLSKSARSAIESLLALRESSESRLQETLQAIWQSRQDYFTAVQAIAESAKPEGAIPLDLRLLDLSELDWRETQRGLRQATHNILTQGIPPGLPDSILESAVRLQVEKEVPSASWEFGEQILLQVLEPNLKEDEEKTLSKAEQAARAVEPVLVAIERDEIIVRKGEEITQADFVLLDHFGKTEREINWLGVGRFAGVVAGAVGIFLAVQRGGRRRLRQQDYLMLLILTLSAPLLSLGPLKLNSLPAIGLLVGSFYGSALGTTVVGLLAFLMPAGLLSLEWSYLLSGAAGGIMGGWLAARMRSREELALVGLGVGLTQALVYLIVNLIVSATASAVWYAILIAAALHGLTGIAWSIVALGLSPYLEHLFDLITPTRLAELANPNRPTLKRLAAETPGTFQHTLFVSSLAEAAAKALCCNVELVRAGTLYHDIGKMHDPQGFIENQMGGPNKHDEIDDPWESAEIIKKHVTEGLVMARKCRLPKAIQSFIPEHQGTMLIAYFYHQALQRAKNDSSIAVREEDFRYPGPIPQSRETGIVMLADSCEAALRSLKEATPEEALNMVKKIVRARWQDQQLLDSGLSKDELLKIAEIFVEVWQQFHHKRIAYPKAVSSMKRC